jgi:hypothetical protein
LLTTYSERIIVDQGVQLFAETVGGGPFLLEAIKHLMHGVVSKGLAPVAGEGYISSQKRARR